MKTPILVPIHLKVPGRARFKIVPDFIRPEIDTHWQSFIERVPGVRRMQRQPVTGSYLMFFDPDLDWEIVAGRIVAAITGILAEPVAGETAREWYRLQPEQVLERTQTSATQGIDPETMDQRRSHHGPNTLTASGPRHPMAILAEQVRSLPMALLLAESTVALAGGAWVEAVLLAGILSLNAAVGYAIDRRAELALMAFKSQPRPSVRVLRAGVWIDAPGESLVVGDILELTPGVYVGADSRIVEAIHLKIDESILTGESQPVEKQAQGLPDRPLAVFDQRNMAFMGTLVVGGKGLGVVVCTGADTEYGKLHRLYEETVPPQTPLIAKIKTLSQSLLNVALALGAGVFGVGWLRGENLATALARGAAIAAAAVPAGLPSAATVNMAVGIRRLKREDISIRRIYSLESLSAVGMICFDKTGTLTQIRIEVRKIHCGTTALRVTADGFRDRDNGAAAPDHPELRRLLQACVLCNESWLQRNGEPTPRRVAGSPTETALLQMAEQAGFDIEKTHQRHPLVKIDHRGDGKRYMASFHQAPAGATLVFVKGDPNEVLELCRWRLLDGKRVRMRAEHENDIETQNQRMAADALRVLGVAYRSLKAGTDMTAIEGLTWIGLVGMAEPIRPGVRPLICRLHRAGIQTVMITGDQGLTADAVAREIGLYGESDPRIFDSTRFDAMAPDLVSALTRDVRVFARVNPSQKLRIVRAFQQRGLVVAMTGDGINDGPALRAADVGIAMGQSGTLAAREVADMVLETDAIASVETAVMEGRASFRNLKRSLRFFISTNLSDLLLNTLAAVTRSGAALGAHRPMQTHLLTDLAPGLALLMEPSHPHMELEPPRDPKAPIFSSRDMTEMFTESCVLTACALAAYGVGIARYGPGPVAATLAHETLSTAKVLHGLTCRPWPAESPATHRPPANPLLSLSTVAALAAQAMAIWIPGLRRLFGIRALAGFDILVMAASAAASLGINRLLRERRQSERRDKPSDDPDCLGVVLHGGPVIGVEQET